MEGMKRAHFNQSKDKKDEETLHSVNGLVARRENEALLVLGVKRSSIFPEENLNENEINRKYEKARRKSLVLMGENQSEVSQFTNSEIDVTFSNKKMTLVEVSNLVE